MNTQPEVIDQPFTPEEMPVEHLRDLLLRRIVDLATLPIGRITLHERSLVDSVLAPAVSRLDLDSRIKLAKRLAIQPEGPRQLISTLAQDEISVAEPLLLENQTLQSADLIHIMHSSTPAHLLAIASRRHLATDAADELANCDDVEAVCRLLSNMNVRLSAMAMEGLVRRSAFHPAYQSLLLARPELTVQLAQLLFWWASPSHRLEILMRFATERRTIHDTLLDVLEPALLLSADDEALTSVLALVREPVVGDRIALARLLSFASHEGEGDFASELGRFARIRMQTALRIVTDMGGEPLAVLAKALSLSRKEFLELWDITAHFRPGISDNAARHEWLCAIFDGVSTDRADFALHWWDYMVASEFPISTPAPDEE